MKNKSLTMPCKNSAHSTSCSWPPSRSFLCLIRHRLPMPSPRFPMPASRKSPSPTLTAPWWESSAALRLIVEQSHTILRPSTKRNLWFKNPWQGPNHHQHDAQFHQGLGHHHQRRKFKLRRQSQHQRQNHEGIPSHGAKNHSALAGNAESRRVRNNRAAGYHNHGKSNIKREDHNEFA